MRAAIIVASISWFAATAAAQTEVPRSPRATVERFLALSRSGEYDQASRMLAIPPDQRNRSIDLARRLELTLDGPASIDLLALSDAPEGRLDDELPRDREQIGEIPSGDTMVPLRLVRRGSRWTFSSATVTAADLWYEGRHERWLLERIPPTLLRTGPFGLAWWQWIGLLTQIASAVLLGLLLGSISRAVLARIVSRTTVAWDDQLLEGLARPIAAAWTLGVFYASLPLLGLYEPAENFLQHAMRVAILVVFFWGLIRAVTVIGRSFESSPLAVARPETRSLVPLATRMLKVAVVIFAVVALLAQLGYSVASLIAGLGIGGLAVALAAQKTMENLFGAFAIAADQPFRVGDFVKVEGDVLGTVESLGLRSTRIRTLDRTLVTIPNGKVADMRVESYTQRDRIRLAATLGVVYGTNEAQMRAVLEGLERVLREHPKIWPDNVVVRFKEFGASSLDIEIMAWFETTDWAEFQAIRQEVLLSFLRVVEEAGSSFAFPTRTIHLVSEPS